MLPRLYAIVDADTAAKAGWSMVGLAGALLDGGARLLQVRGKSLSGRDFLDAAAAIVRLARAVEAIVIVNDRADIAKLAFAHGVHLGQEDLPPSAARQLLGADAIVGRSTHTLAQIEAAEREPIDYLAVGPVFATATKNTGYDPIGLETVRAASRSRLPVVAIGGIALETAPSVIEAGAAAVGIIGDLVRTGDPQSRVREYTSRLERI